MSKRAVVFSIAILSMAGSASAQGVAEPAHPKTSLAALISDEDYPNSALAAGQSGTVAVRFDVGPNGRISACTVLRSSGASALDAATCRLLTARARFTPARDETGTPVPSVFTHAQTWHLPGQ
jgi:protein TonB